MLLTIKNKHKPENPSPNSLINKEKMGCYHLAGEGARL